ncbi:hypothetical protein ACWD4V_01240 [Streptomyces tsukubensis]
MITKMPMKQRRALLAAIDTGGRLPTGISSRVLDALPEAWARTEARTGHRWLTDEGWAALIPTDRFRNLTRANPETGTVTGLNYAERRGLSRDGLIVIRDPAGTPVDPTDHVPHSTAYITPRGRRLVGMPLTAPAFSTRIPPDSWAIWRRPGQPDRLVHVRGWQMSDGTVRVWDREARYYPEVELPAAELRPLPRRVRRLHTASPASRPVEAARNRLARTTRTVVPAGQPRQP